MRQNWRVTRHTLRANTIINKLYSIEGKLDDIRDVQYSAYATLTSVKSSLASLDGKMSNAVKELARMPEGIESIEKSSAATAYHAEAAAHYAKITADIASAASFGIIFLHVVHPETVKTERLQQSRGSAQTERSPALCPLQTIVEHFPTSTAFRLSFLALPSNQRRVRHAYPLQGIRKESRQKAE